MKYLLSLFILVFGIESAVHAAAKPTKSGQRGVASASGKHKKKKKSHNKKKNQSLNFNYSKDSEFTAQSENLFKGADNLVANVILFQLPNAVPVSLKLGHRQLIKLLC